MISHTVVEERAQHRLHFCGLSLPKDANRNPRKNNKHFIMCFTPSLARSHRQITFFLVMEKGVVSGKLLN